MARRQTASGFASLLNQSAQILRCEPGAFSSHSCGEHAVEPVHEQRTGIGRAGHGGVAGLQSRGINAAGHAAGSDQIEHQLRLLRLRGQ